MGFLDNVNVSKDWRVPCIMPFYNGNRDISKCIRNIGINLLSVLGKVYDRIIIDRLGEITESQLGIKVHGFREGRV